MITVSIIIPVYQGKSYLKRCIDSVLAQSCQEYEIILVDDGSTDGSAEICDEYAEKQKTITVIHKENGGLSSARNAGLEIASGEYVMFIDADDVVHSKMLETELKVLKEENADIFICGLKRFAEIEEVDTCAELQIKNCVEIQSGLEIESKLFVVKTWKNIYPVVENYLRKQYLMESVFRKGGYLKMNILRINYIIEVRE